MPCCIIFIFTSQYLFFREKFNTQILKNMLKKLGLLFVISLLLMSCVSTKEIHYFQNINSNNKGDKAGSNFETTIKSDDLLMIVVSSENMDAVEKFNLPLIGVPAATAGSLDQVTTQVRTQSYLVDKNGQINFPVLGSIKVGGLTKTEVMSLLDQKLRKYINNPIINLRILNFEVSILGEVARPGSFPIVTERISIFEALAMAGDMTIYGNRKSVIVQRDVDGVKTFAEVDLTSADIINSPYYYLQQNDAIYVKQSKVKSNSAGVGPNTTVILSSASLLVAILAMILK